MNRPLIFGLGFLFTLTLVDGAGANRGEPSEYQECLKIEKTGRFLQNSPQEIQCHPLFIQVGPQKNSKRYRPSKTVDIAAFNAYWMGQGAGLRLVGNNSNMRTTLKSYSQIAGMLNQWDVIAVTEIMPLPKQEQRVNDQIDQYLDQVQKLKNSHSGVKKLTPSRLKEDYIAPGYLRLLLALQEESKDSSWALLLSPHGQGTSRRHQELTGFYYRSSKVRPRELKYCKGQVACFAKGPLFTDEEGNRQNALARMPFVAGFESGQFQFVLTAAHLRYRAPDQESASAEALEPYQVLTYLYQKRGGKELLQTGSKRLKNYVYQFAELRVVRDILNRIRKTGEKDVILLGDLNLPMEGDERPSGFSSEEKDSFQTEDWSNALEFALNSTQKLASVEKYKRLYFKKKRWEMFVSEPTSISSKSGLNTNYDHFVFDPRETTECPRDQIRSFNYLDPSKASGLDRFIARGLEDYGKSLYKDFSEKGLIQSGRYVRRFDKKDLGQFQDDFEEKMLRSQDSNPYLAYIELMSDHIPVVMRCRAD